jgi:hypothetical protein
MRLCGTVFTLVLFVVAGGGGTAQEPRKEPPVPKLSEAKQARWDKARAILAKPDQVELFSLDPSVDPAGPDERFRGWKVLGKTVVKDADARKAVLTVAGAIKPGWGVRCFDPRHGIRATAGGKTVEVVICFSCRWAWVYLDKEKDEVQLTIDRDQQSALDKVLTDAKVPLPPPAKD